jgi:hypothetical protein
LALGSDLTGAGLCTVRKQDCASCSKHFPRCPRSPGVPTGLLAFSSTSQAPASAASAGPGCCFLRCIGLFACSEAPGPCARPPPKPPGRAPRPGPRRDSSLGEPSRPDRGDRARGEAGDQATVRARAQLAGAQAQGTAVGGGGWGCESWPGARPLEIHNSAVPPTESGGGEGGEGAPTTPEGPQRCPGGLEARKARWLHFFLLVVSQTHCFVFFFFPQS